MAVDRWKTTCHQILKIFGIFQQPCSGVSPRGQGPGDEVKPGPNVKTGLLRCKLLGNGLPTPVTRRFVFFFQHVTPRSHTGIY